MYNKKIQTSTSTEENIKHHLLSNLTIFVSLHRPAKIYVKSNFGKLSIKVGELLYIFHCGSPVP
jgi:hypothetical protein